MPSRSFRQRRAYRPRRTTRRPRRTTGMRSIAKKVNRIARRESMNHIRNTYTRSTSFIINNVIHQSSLMEVSNWTRQFGASTAQEYSSRALVERLNCRWRFTLHNPAGNYVATSVINYTFFVVQLKDNINLGSYYNNTTGVLSFTAGTTHFVAGKRTILNPKMFNVLYSRTGYVGNASQNISTDTAVASTVGISKDFVYTYKKPTMIENPNGFWASLNGPIPDPSKNIYALLFTDGTYGTTQPILDQSVIASTKSLGQ